MIVNSNLEDSQVESLITRYQELVTKNGGEVTSIDRWGRRRLAYTIRKKNAGYYVQMLHNSPTDIIPKLEQMFKLDEEVIRHLTIVVDKNMQKARAGVKKYRRKRASRSEHADNAAATSGRDHDQKS
ncbi:MAG: 30S ribosomal protein S6 [Bacteroidetes bacterium]|nr:30S ribosomal protein S6 [Bacteroidota bacterium]